MLIFSLDKIAMSNIQGGIDTRIFPVSDWLVSLDVSFGSFDLCMLYVF